jgi:hypothetical protein
LSQVVIGMDPHKRSATIEVMTADESVAGGGRYGTDAAGRAAMLAGVRQWPDRIRAVEGSRGVGRQVAAWLAGSSGDRRRQRATGRGVVNGPLHPGGEGGFYPGADAPAFSHRDDKYRPLPGIAGGE